MAAITFLRPHLQDGRVVSYNGGRSQTRPQQELTMKRSLGAKTLIYPTPTWIVGSYDKQGKPNGMTAAWGGICCSDPPCVAVSLRKATYSYGSLVNRQAFTISVPSQSQVKVADYFDLETTDARMETTLRLRRSVSGRRGR
jgi:flavin reductase (DIM6/NTAB) family NADH-FMN oxidoreductase RutF